MEPNEPQDPRPTGPSARQVDEAMDQQPWLGGRVRADQVVADQVARTTNYLSPQFYQWAVPWVRGFVYNRDLSVPDATFRIAGMFFLHTTVRTSFFRFQGTPMRQAFISGTAGMRQPIWLYVFYALNFPAFNTLMLATANEVGRQSVRSVIHEQSGTRHTPRSSNDPRGPESGENPK